MKYVLSCLLSLSQVPLYSFRKRIYRCFDIGIINSLSRVIIRYCNLDSLYISTNNRIFFNIYGRSNLDFESLLLVRDVITSILFTSLLLLLLLLLPPAVEPLLLLSPLSLLLVGSVSSVLKGSEEGEGIESVGARDSNISSVGLSTESTRSGGLSSLLSLSSTPLLSS